MSPTLQGPGLWLICAVRAIEYALIGWACAVSVDAVGGLPALVHIARSVGGMLVLN